MNKQEEVWTSELGDKYSIENSDFPTNELLFQTKHIDETVYSVYSKIFDELDRNYRILEVGCNVGHKLRRLQMMGFKNLYGLDANLSALALGEAQYEDIHFIHQDLSTWKTIEKFDIVMTNYMLIHVSPKFINETLRKCYDLSRKYMFHLEFDTGDIELEIPWLDKKDICWKRDMSYFYKNRSTYGGIGGIIKDIHLPRSEDGNFDSAVLWCKD